MVVVAPLVTVVLSGALLWAGLEKLRATEEFGQTLTQLGVPRFAVRAVLVAVLAAELSVAATLLLFPASPWPRLGVVALGVVFAAAGLIALGSRRSIACSCLGATGSGVLGWRQVALLPGWLAGAYLLMVSPPRWVFADGLRYLAALVVALGAVRAVAVVHAWRSAVGNRTALDEAIIVRPSIFARTDLTESDVA